MPLMPRLALGAMAAWGAVFAFVAVNMDLVDSGALPGIADDGSVFGPVIRGLSAVNALAVFMIFAVIAMRARHLRAIQAVTWVFAMMFFYPLALPAFWFFHVWRNRSPAVPPADPHDHRSIGRG